MPIDSVLEFPNSSQRAREGAEGRVGRGTLGSPDSVRDDGNPNRQPGPHDNLSQRYVVERGGGSSGTAYNKFDFEVLDQHRKAGNRIIARATGSDARLIAWALNQMVP